MIYYQNLHNDVKTFFMSEIHDNMIEIFHDDLIMDYFKRVNQNVEIDLTEDNLALSGFSERLHDNLKTIQEENRSMIQNLIQNNSMEIINQIKHSYNNKTHQFRHQTENNKK